MKRRERIKSRNRLRELYRFARAQVSSFTGGITDYLVMIALTEWTGMHYAVSILLSGMLGAAINFTINRYWAFDQGGRRRKAIGSQLMKFTAVVSGSILLKSSGTFLVSTYLTLDYRISRLVVELLVSYGFNYVLMRYWVFRPLRMREA